MLALAFSCRNGLYRILNVIRLAWRKVTLICHLYTIIPLCLWLTSSYSFCFLLYCFGLCDTFFSLISLNGLPFTLILSMPINFTLIQILELTYSIKCACNPLSSVGLYMFDKHVLNPWTEVSLNLHGHVVVQRVLNNLADQAVRDGWFLGPVHNSSIELMRSILQRRLEVAVVCKSKHAVQVCVWVGLYRTATHWSLSGLLGSKGSDKLIEPCTWMPVSISSLLPD